MRHPRWHNPISECGFQVIVLKEAQACLPLLLLLPCSLPSLISLCPPLSSFPCLRPLIDAVLLLSLSEACAELVLRARQGRVQGKIVSPQSAAPRLLSRRAGRSLEPVLPGQCAPGGAIIWRARCCLVIWRKFWPLRCRFRKTWDEMVKWGQESVVESALNVGIHYFLCH